MVTPSDSISGIQGYFLLILLFRSEFQYTDTQIKYKFYQTQSFIILCCLYFSIFVHTFLLFPSHRGAAEIV